MIDEAIEDNFRGIISHALLGEKGSISKEGFDLIINELKKATTKEIEKAYKAGMKLYCIPNKRGIEIQETYWQQYKQDNKT